MPQETEDALLPAEATAAEETSMEESAAPRIDPEITQMLELASAHGYICQPLTKWSKEIGHSIASRMVPRLGEQVYQVFAYNIPNCPKAALMKIFPSKYITEATDTVTTWTLSSASSLTETLSPLLSESTFTCAGSTKAFKAASQPVIRVVSKLMPDFVISHVILDSGLERVYVNGMYALVTESGEMHWPKDEKRKEINVAPSLEAELRAEVLSEMRSLGDAGRPLSPGWWRQLQEEDKAREVEEALAHPRRRSRPSAGGAAQLAPPRKKAKKAKKEARFVSGDFEIERVVAEKKVTRKEKINYLVRWSGVDASWEAHRISGEVGEPIETWEYPCVVANTVALREWKAQKATQKARWHEAT